MSSGKNPDYEFNPELEGGTLRHVGHRSNTRTDIDFMYLEQPTNLISVEGKTETRTSDRLLLLSYGMALQEAGIITISQASSWAHNVVTHESPSNLCRELKNKFYKKESDDYLCAVYRIIEQATGRAARTEMKRETIYILADAELMQLLSNDDRDAALFSHEYRELVNYAKNKFAWINPPVDRESRRNQNLALLNTARSQGAIGRMLSLINNNPSDEVIQSWQNLRYLTLKAPATSQAPTYLEYYVNSPESGGYDYTPPVEEWMVDKYRFFEQSISPLNRVCEAKAMLPVFVRNEAVKAHFEANGFATKWAEGSGYVLTPPMFINIYLGALGEEVGKAVLSSQGFKFEPIPPQHFEQFDEIIVLGEQKALIDFKHWDLAAWRSLPDDKRKDVMLKLSKKLSFLGLNKLVICNMLKQGDEPISYFDSNFNALVSEVNSSIIVLPNLINEHDSSVNISTITALARWMITE